MLKNENEKVKKQMKELMQKQNLSQKDGNQGMDYDDYYRKLLAIVKLEGNDPVWRKYANLALPSYAAMTQEELQAECKLTWNSKL